ncbi:MAG TPA: hypothetical protein VJ816_04885, partial [Gemmatimonadales bacterium]|nr:hypothetical protein [Gemmatimonadales bacterium]
MQRLVAVPLVVAAAVVSSTCRGAEPIGPAVPASVAVVSGSTLTGVAGHALPQPLTVKVTAADGTSIPGIAVLWAARSSGGSLSATTVATDAQGLAAVTFTLGPLAGSQRDTVTATVTGLASVNFVISATADVAAQMVMISGNGQLGVVGQTLTQPLVIETRDQFGNPTSGTNVTWSVIAGGGNVSAAASVTDALGRASVNWTLGTAPGVAVDSLSASAAGLAGSPATFTASAQLGPVATLVMISGDGQVAAVAQAVPESLVVQALDQFSNPVPDATVRWAAAGGSGSVSQVSVATDAAGRSAVQWTLGTTSG